jgi:hypothetical protein
MFIYFLVFDFFFEEQINVEELWKSANSGGWKPSSAPRSKWPRMCSSFYQNTIFYSNDVSLC